MRKDERQLELPLARPKLTLIKGEGQRVEEPLLNRDAVTRVLIETGADVLLRRISPERAEHIEGRVEEILALFDKVDKDRSAQPLLQARLDELESLMRDTRAVRKRRRI